ncbi:CST complex subunit CTC1 isoform X1 [Vigna radiata var. radiata]|uniref:CST complex subunit CTC1 n=1 Tax=Vigna radiata var. radiata TaxID=3916 RepID=A0A1S3TDY8_VIGRR|nr:CST complex subunit CTC1 isoform X1 [Vigna radiata var. radiata]
MDDANATVTTLAELLQSPRPVTATAHSVFSSTPPPHRSTTCCVLTALPRSTVLVGTLALPALSPPCSCLRFSDASATLCCDLLRFRPAALNREIRVTAWNFIPFKRHGCDVAHGLLEIINWRFSDTNQGSNAVDSLPLAPNCVRQSGARMRSLHGVVESVGPLFVVQCTMAASTSGLNSGSKVNLPGFSVQLVCCECRFCCSKEVLIGKLNETRKGHSFTKMEIVYFCGSASSWHPAITKLIDERVVVSGLKKKLVYLTKEESREMYVTKDESVLHVESCSEKCMPSLKSEIKGKGECGSYSGVVKGAYMQGMVLELDHDVWLLLTDQLHTSMHGLRVGSILSVRNVHIVNPHFSWTKIIILGACIKTSIIVQSFSPCQTVCNVVFPSTGMLGKFIQSLPFSARLWVLLLVSSFRKKFDGILSDKEILGSKHKEGLVQMYASSLFPWSIFQTQQGAPLWLCTHDLNGCGRVLNCSFLKLVIPISIFICHCIHTLLRIMKSESHCKLLPIGNQFSILSREARYNGRSLRRIIQSEDVGVVLLGYLKVDPSTRRLQLVDATGGVDIVIQDLPLTWNPNEIYEVTDYEVFMDKIDEPVDQIERLGSESLSCRTIFDCSKAERELSTPFFVCCHWKNVKCRNIPLYSCINSKNESETLEPGSYHVLRVSHKFPLQEKYSNKAGCSKSSTFVEAMLFPFILLFDGKSGIAHPSNASWDKTKELSKSCLSGNNEYKFSNKRQKLVKESVSSSKEEFHTSIYELSACSNSSRKPEENRKRVNMRSSHDLSCLVTFKSLQSENQVCPAILRPALPMKDASLNSKPSSRKILLEFSSDRFLKYQLLQIGDYYIIDNKRSDCFGSTKDVDFGRSDNVKLLIDSGKRIWSLSFIYDENLSDHLSEYTSAKDSLSPSADGVSSNHQKLLPRSNSEPSSVNSDVCLYLPISFADVFEDNVIELEDSRSLQSVISEDSANLSLGTGTSEDRPKSCFRTQRSNSLFPEGNLMSLEGNVIEIHKTGSGFFSSCSSGANVDSLQLTGLVGTRSNFCIHVLVHHHIVNICGSVNKHTFPTGFGSGVTAVFHRILYARAQNKFMLLPVSFIVIKSIKVCDKQCGDRPSVLSATKDADDASREYISCLISELPQGLTHKKIVLRCRVVAVLVLVIERKTTNFIAETKVNAQGTLLDIPLACFLLEDGSSSCCCWASAERAATLLRLREELTTSHHLGRILKKHKKITVKSHGLSVDSPCQDHIFTVASGNALCSSDENILKFIICNACIGGIWNVVAGGMDAEETRQLGEEYLTEMLNVHNMRNMWAEEVSYPRTRAEARHMIQELLKN